MFKRKAYQNKQGTGNLQHSLECLLLILQLFSFSSYEMSCLLEQVVLSFHNPWKVCLIKRLKSLERTRVLQSSY